jgi:hypothetical protein
LWAAALLTLITGYDYLVQGIRHIVKTDHAPLSKRQNKSEIDPGTSANNS